MNGKLMVTLVAVLLCTAQAAIAKDELSYSGSSTIGMSILEQGALKAFEAKTGKKFASVEQPGSGKGVKALIEGKVSIGGASRVLTSEEKKAGVLSHIIGYDAIAVFVNKANPVKNLTKDQLKGIFTGKIRNWKEVGGKDAPISVNTEILGEKRATMLVFQELAMDNAAYGTGFKEIDFPRDQITEAAKDPNGICTVSFGLLAALPADLQGKVKAVSVNNIDPEDANIRSGAYLISRPLVLGTMGLPKGEVKEFINFMLSKEGQEIVSRNFVPVRR
jgi:phosphate transport system substrate-binding protein